MPAIRHYYPAPYLFANSGDYNSGHTKQKQSSTRFCGATNARTFFFIMLSIGGF